MAGGRFGQRRDMVADGYRDVSISVLYTHPSSNLSIIGEIQVEISSGLDSSTNHSCSWTFLMDCFLSFSTSFALRLKQLAL
jgi:hypothetical protein